MKISEIKESDLIKMEITEVTKMLGVSGMIITDELKKNGFEYDRDSGDISLDGVVVKVVNNGSNTTRIKMMYVFLAEVKEVLKMMNDPELKKQAQINFEEEIEHSFGFDSTYKPFELDANTKTFHQIEYQLRRYYEENQKAIA